MCFLDLRNIQISSGLHDTFHLLSHFSVRFHISIPWSIVSFPWFSLSFQPILADLQSLLGRQFLCIQHMNSYSFMDTSFFFFCFALLLWYYFLISRSPWPNFFFFNSKCCMILLSHCFFSIILSLNYLSKLYGFEKNLYADNSQIYPLPCQATYFVLPCPCLIDILNLT